MDRISDAELAASMAAQIDADGNDLALEAWVDSLTAEQRRAAEANVRDWVQSAREALGLDSRELTRR
ncbi:MAG: hypothetical protein JNK04_12085 [Myxococcales bacterium]|nr:hypothetical protein [Myxococcales bacterium]